MAGLETGQRFTRLVVLYEDVEAGKDYGKPKYRVRCDCGTEFTTSRARLLNGTCRSCGCIRVENCIKMQHKPRVLVEYNGETHSFPEWSRITGINEKTLRARYFRKHLQGDELFSKKNMWTGKEIKIQKS